ncbi:MAG: tetratricopeptide repeat protein, partial [Buchnera aphidicola]|nr:tetratricopeptide repeat protein [Buchnera aphidicola]MDE5286032.1 tetratricopeptide repeat protein [Buchnera aphidicola]
DKIEKFIIDNKNIYGTLASMFLAKKYVLDNNLEKAIKQLETSLKYTKDEILKNILLLKIVSLEIEQNQNERALNTLKQVNDKNWIN